MTEPPPAQWEELAAKDATALGPLVVPRTTVGGPFPATDGSTIPKCFAPNPTGALTAGYYMWAMTDARLPLETRKAFLEATVAQDDEGRDEYIQTTLNSPVRIHITGIRLSAPVANNTAVVEVALEYQGRRIIAHSPMYWSGDTWVTGTYTETAPVEGPLFRWAP
ncbi:hypothetical protein [Enemella evansiae]|uniref:hypothetical protein n=1 Tax=Enemella evansiae TaxID=2016499 RepID=UPI001140289E|nr:hypothetical protein [Enemella evansiae]